jgi:hypothetical protein
LRLPRAAPHHLNLNRVPGISALDPGFHSRRNADLEDQISWSRTAQHRRHGLHVNGPGEFKHANIGISLPGTTEAPAAPVFVDGKKFRTLHRPTIAAGFKALLIDYIDQRYGDGGKGPETVTTAEQRLPLSEEDGARLFGVLLSEALDSGLRQG